MSYREITKWQEALNRGGSELDVDGDFGQLTLRASLAALDGPRAMRQELPLDWMPNSTKMKRIIAHWTAGSHNVSRVDREHYHFIWAGDGTVHQGDHSVTDNEVAGDGDYAAHTLRCNTGSIGVSVACMAGAKEQPFDAGLFPMTEDQWNGMVRGIAQLCRRYGIPVVASAVLTHAEVEDTLGIDQRGKWDITRLPWDDSVQGATEVGHALRNAVDAALA
jgi:hypothetical protein